MSEQRIRALLREVCDELDGKARGVMLASLVAGAGLTGCDKAGTPALGPDARQAEPVAAEAPDAATRPAPVEAKPSVPGPVPPYGVAQQDPVSATPKPGAIKASPGPDNLVPQPVPPYSVPQPPDPTDPSKAAPRR